MNNVLLYDKRLTVESNIYKKLYFDKKLLWVYYHNIKVDLFYIFK